MNKDSKENRGLFINFLKSREMLAANTFFDKPASKRVTYKEQIENDELNDSRNNPPYNYAKYAQCDYVIVQKKPLTES